MSKNIVRLASLTAVGVGGWLGGGWCERWKRRSATIHAAHPLESSVIESNKLAAVRTPEIMRYGYPGFDNVRTFNDYVLSYDRRNRTAHWVMEHLTRNRLGDKKLVDRELCKFQEDPTFHKYFQATNDDYYKSGFDRGHLAAAGNHRVQQQDCDQTFYLSNIAPQVGVGFNRHGWNKLEKYTRHLTKYYEHVYVCTGPLYLPRKEVDGKTYVKYQVIGANHVAVPTHFFKVVIGETDKHEFDLEAFVMPNAVLEENPDINKYRVPVDSIERAAGFLLFDKIPRERIRKINSHRGFK